VALILVLLLLVTACNANDPAPVIQPTAVVLPQPTAIADSLTPSSTSGFGEATTARQIVEVRIDHARDLSEILVQAGDTVEVGSTLAQLSGYAAELSWEAQLAEEQLAEARARLAQAEADLVVAHEGAASAHEQAVGEAAARVTKLSRQVAALQRQKQIADAELAQARATTEYRQRWLDILKPLQEFDPWGDLPYLVGTQSGPKGLRSDLAYRESLARAEYELHLAELEETIARLEWADATAELEETQADLEAAQATLEHLQATSLPLAPRPSLEVYEASVRIGEIRLAQARARLEETVIRSLVVGKVLDVKVDRVVGNEATMVIRIMAEHRPEPRPERDEGPAEGR
jgi:multidrug efflux pump subunit AcrA (membrane-fusion protein)